MKEKIIRIVPLLLCIVLFVSTFVAWKVTRDVVDMEVRRNFNQEVQVIKHWTQDRLNLYLPISLGIRIFFESSDKITVAEWSAYIQRLKLIDKYPGISSITYIEHVKGKSGDRYIVRYVEPLDRNKEMIGLDLSADQKRVELLNSARDEDPTSTGRVTLLITPKKGFEIVLPVYRKGPAPITVQDRRTALKGFIKVDFEGSRLFQDIFTVVDSTNLNFEVYSSVPNTENLLYTQGQDYSALNPRYKPKMTARDTFEFNGQTWYLVAASRPDFTLTPSQERLPLVVLGSGFLFSVIFLGIYLYLLKHNQTLS